MGRTPSAERQLAETLVGTLEQMLAELAQATHATEGDDVAWLRPLAVLSVEIEYSAVRTSEVDSLGLAGACRDLDELLAGFSGDGGEFAARYARAHRAFPAVAMLHARAVAACQEVATSRRGSTP